MTLMSLQRMILKSQKDLAEYSKVYNCLFIHSQHKQLSCWKQFQTIPNISIGGVMFYKFPPPEVLGPNAGKNLDLLPNMEDT